MALHFLIKSTEPEPEPVLLLSSLHPLHSIPSHLLLPTSSLPVPSHLLLPTSSLLPGLSQALGKTHPPRWLSLSSSKIIKNHVSDLLSWVNLQPFPPAVKVVFHTLLKGMLFAVDEKGFELLVRVFNFMFFHCNR